ncbi:benzoylformate decarboxylase [Streptomyces sp. NBC_00654]|uniref:benzoylformate decarboxylase n=1 Tax=Streptomyces sp. NBC_00654 TaxID=2975799 RepID=UPI002252BBAC|nr:benzoylformate decarboxylase [Streptomyces sp. NBC_00654]MCX4966987.1 benzoylformate decarboxylase [Streptomyces sp. NBC_00654]
MTRTNETATVREAVFDLLRAEGMTTIFGNPGSLELPMLRDFPDDFRYVLGLQESVVVAMADGYAQATHRPVLVNLHSAAGVGHAMGALFTAHRNRTPLVVVAGQQARSLLEGHPYLLSQDATTLPRPYVKLSREPARAEDVPAAIARARYLATAPPAGPVLVSVPSDDWDRTADRVAVRLTSTTVAPDPALLARVGDALANARSPVLIAGSGVDREGAVPDLVALAEAHRAPVWAEPMSHRCAFPELHPLFAGFLPPVREDIVRTLAGHDLVLSVGAPVFTYHVPGAGPHLPPGTDLHLLTDDPEQASWCPGGTAVITGLAPALRMLGAHRPGSPRTPPPARRRPGPPARSTSRITQAHLVHALAEERPEGCVLVEEAPGTRPVMCELLPNLGPETFYTTASGALGHGLPAAVGIALGRPGTRVVAVVGDGSAMYAVQALWSAAQLGVAVTVIVVNNHRYATVDGFAERFGMARPVGTALGGLDFAALATAQGCAAGRVENPAALVPALRTALTSSCPYVLDVVVDR